MNRKWRKRMMAIVAGIGAAAMLASCTGGKQSANGKDTQIPTLVWYVPGDNQSDLPRVLEEVNKIIEPELGVNLDLQFIDQASYTERLQMMMGSKTEFDMMLTGYVNPFENAIQKGGLMDITEYVKNNENLYSQMPEYAWQAASVAGKIYAVPNQQIWASCWGMAFRKDIVEKYGYDTSRFQTLRDAEEFWDLVRKNDPDLIPLWLSTGDNTLYLDKYEGIAGGCSYNRENGEVEMTAVSEDQKEYLSLMNEWYNKGYIRKDVATVQDQTADFRAGRYASTLVTYKPGVEQSKKTQSGGYDWIAIPFSTPYIKRSSITATSTAISATSKHPEECIRFLEMINTNKELYRLICHGIEGIHYNKIDEETIEYINSSGYMPAADWKFGNQFNAYVVSGNPKDVWEQTKKMNQEAEISPLIGFSFVRDNVATEITQISTVNKKYAVAFTSDIEEQWGEMTAEYQNAGIEQICDEINRQIEEYQKAQGSAE